MQAQPDLSKWDHVTQKHEKPCFSFPPGPQVEGPHFWDTIPLRKIRKQCLNSCFGNMMAQQKRGKKEKFYKIRYMFVEWKIRAKSKVVINELLQNKNNLCIIGKIHFVLL